MADTINIADQVIEPGTKKGVPLKVTRDLNGNNITVWVHAIHGSQPGSTLGLFSVQHGDEWITFELLRQIVESRRSF